jgi:hypothetical protein
MRLTYQPSQGVYEIAMSYLMRKFRAEMGFRAIVLRAYWYFRYGGSDGGSGAFDFRCYSFLKDAGYPELDDCHIQYRDISATIPWGLGGFSPQYGMDITSSPIAKITADQNGLNNGDLFDPLDITEYFAKQLLENDDLWLSLFQVTSSSTLWIGSSTLVERPKLIVDYLFPVEMYPEHPTESGYIDLSRLLNTDNEPISLGAYQKGETGAAHLFFVKNFSRSAIAHLEVWDDFPEWTQPEADSGNGGSGVLGYVEPFEACVSQRWEVKFSSSSAFEIKAEAYLDNIESLHPQYDADSDWLGTTASDFDSVDGSLRIPSAAWSGTPSAGDIFVFYTRGQTTNPAWPSDSNDQVEIAEDDGGSPGTWRPINGQRTILTTADSVDAATITIAVKRIDVNAWPLGDPVFIADSNNIDIGEIQSVTPYSITIENLTITNNNYGIGAIVATTLPIRSLAASPWAQTTADSGASEADPRKIYIANADTYGFSGGANVYLQSNDVPDNYENLIIANITSTYIEVTTDLENDYEVGSVLVERETGEKKFYLRVNSDLATDEELKQFRLNIIA